MEKNFASIERKAPNPHQQPELAAASVGTYAARKERAGADCGLNVYISYELKCRLVALAEKFELSFSDIVRQVLKAGLPVFESLSAAQEELISGYIELLRKGRSMGELKK